MNKYQIEYVKYLKKFLVPQKPIKVVFDCSNGTAGTILKNLKNKNLKIILINEKPDGNFPGHGPNPLNPGAIDDLKKAVLNNRADFGVIFDADADRAFFADDKGRFINPDEIAYLLIWHFKFKKIVADVKTGFLIRDLKARNELKIYESRVGHYFIKQILRAADIEFGCENSGHYYYKKFFYADSGILTAMEVINAVSKLPYKLSDYIDLLPKFYRSGEINIKCCEMKGLYEKIFNRVIKEYRNKAVKADELDGLRMEFDGKERWWFNIRASNTEPLIRLNVEATNKQLLAKEKKMLLRWLNGKEV